MAGTCSTPYSSSTPATTRPAEPCIFRTRRCCLPSGRACAPSTPSSGSHGRPNRRAAAAQQTGDLRPAVIRTQLRSTERKNAAEPVISPGQVSWTLGSAFPRSPYSRPAACPIGGHEGRWARIPPELIKRLTAVMYVCGHVYTLTAQLPNWRVHGRCGVSPKPVWSGHRGNAALCPARRPSGACTHRRSVLPVGGHQRSGRFALAQGEGMPLPAAPPHRGDAEAGSPLPTSSETVARPRPGSCQRPAGLLPVRSGTLARRRRASERS